MGIIIYILLFILRFSSLSKEIRFYKNRPLRLFILQEKQGKVDGDFVINISYENWPCRLFLDHRMTSHVSVQPRCAMHCMHAIFLIDKPAHLSVESVMPLVYDHD